MTTTPHGPTTTAPAPAPAAGPERPESDLVDIRDMVVVHTAMLRELRLAPVLVAGVEPGDTRRAGVVERHLQLMCDLVHHHHSGEDALLWPVLEPRLAAADRARVAAAEVQHAGIDEALTGVTTARASWVGTASEADRDRLAAALTRFHALLAEHLEFEERHLLPLAAAHLTQPEWAAIGEAGAKSVPGSKMLLVFGMFAYEGDPAVLADMLSAAPPPARVLVPRVAPRVYARYARKVHGTRTP